MKTDKPPNKDLYYTGDHEWIDFQGSVAYVGICRFKLLGFKQIEQVIFTAFSGFKEKGENIATICYKDYRIEANMPVDGKIIRINEDLLASKTDSLLNYSESSGWIALIVPSHPYERKNLLLPEQYRLNGKSKYAK
jgi:glycine cleavage system H protein